MTDVRITPAVGAAGTAFMTPTVQGLAGWSLDPAACDNAMGTVNGVSYAVRIPVSRTPITTLVVGLTVAATGPVAGQCWGAFHRPDGTLISKGELSGLTTAGVGSATVGTFTPDTDWIVGRVLFNASTPPQLLRGSGSAGLYVTVGNAPLGAPDFRAATIGSSLTDLASYDPATAAQGLPFYLGAY